METPRVRETACRRRLRVADADAIERNRAINAESFVDLRRDPIADMTFDVAGVVAAFHDYPSDDLFDALDERCMA